MNNYKNEFNQINEIIKKKKIIPKKVNIKHNSCYFCNTVKRVDTDNCIYVCINCGVISSGFDKPFIEMSQYNNDTHRIDYISFYDRKCQFKKKIFQYQDKNKLHFSKYLVNRLEIKFIQINEIFNEICDGRKNFIRYNYIIYKLLELMDYDRYLKDDALPKTKNILKSYDEYWEKICQKLNWNFFKTHGIKKKIFYNYIKQFNVRPIGRIRK